MKQALTIFFTGVAIAGAVTLVSARSPHQEEAVGQPQLPVAVSAAYAQAGEDIVSRDVPITIFAPRYTSSPRIIHVARPNSRAEVHEEGAVIHEDSAATDIDNDYVPPPRPPLVRRIKPAPRADVHPVDPQLAPTEKLELSPVYPTPRFSKSTAAVPRDPPVEVPPPTVASTPSDLPVDMTPPPPVGYTPPSDLPPEQK